MLEPDRRYCIEVDRVDGDRCIRVSRLSGSASSVFLRRTVVMIGSQLSVPLSYGQLTRHPQAAGRRGIVEFTRRDRASPGAVDFRLADTASAWLSRPSRPGDSVSERLTRNSRSGVQFSSRAPIRHESCPAGATTTHKRCRRHRGQLQGKPGSPRYSGVTRRNV